eukprot:scaffold44817_cov46-Attheya_sp.AAC.4
MATCVCSLREYTLPNRGCQWASSSTLDQTITTIEQVSQSDLNNETNVQAESGGLSVKRR